MGQSRSAPRRAFAFLFAAVLVVGQVASVAAAGQGRSVPATNPASAPGGARIDEALLKALAAGTTDHFVVEFGAKTDLSGAKKIKDRTKKGAFVLNSLRKTAATSQVGAKALVAKTKGARAESYWLANTMVVHGDAALARKIGALAGVAAIRAEKVYPLVKPVPASAVIAAVEAEWGVAMVRAPEVWADGITGQGVVVGSIDTGVEYTHEALVAQYRGNNHDGSFSNDYNWWDPAGICDRAPCDNVGHGTHTMGTIVGGDGDGPLPDIGVAPGAQWMTAKGCEDFGCSESSLLSSGQFILAPTDLNGDNPNPALRPDVVSNSWGNDNPSDSFYQATVEAWRAAGIIPVFAAGNAGPGCSTAGAPGNAVEVISVGATDDKDNIADFSSRGPSPSDKISPNVSAPGVDVVSSVPGGGYGPNSGTSMATPHVTGVIALMLSAKPALDGNFDAVLDALSKTAVDRPDDQCGTPDPSDNDPNYVYGEGRVDAKAAVDLVKTGGTLAGTVTDADTAAPIGGARVSANDGSRVFTATTDATGNYDLFLAAGEYIVSADAFGYQGDVAPPVTIVADTTTDQDFALTALPRFVVTGHVHASEDGSALQGASVKAVGTPVPATMSAADGSYSLTLPIGAYTLEASAGGCTETGSADIASDGPDQVQDFSLFRKLDDFGHGCRPIDFAWIEANDQTALYGDEFAGRLRLPFDFPFYGESYGALFLSDNGYVNFLKADQFNPFPVGLPSPSVPNAAIYALWQDLYLDDGSAIDTATLGSAPDRTFAIEYSGVKSFSGSGRVSFEIVLHEDGTIDLLYGDNPANPGDGRNAGIGIENATGTDALQFSLFDADLGPNQAWRFELVPSGLVHGTVTDANDGLPVAGAHVTATPGGRTATTAADGTYALRLRPGAYDVTASAADYVDSSTTLAVSDGSDDTRDFALSAAIGAAEPTTIEATVDFGSTTTATVNLANSGSAPLVWTAKERDLGGSIGTFPTASVSSVLSWRPGWHRPIVRGALPDMSGVREVLPPSSLQPIIDDPADDSNGSIEATQVRGGSDGQSVMAMAIDFSAGTPIDQAVGEIYVDVDQDAKTGIPAEFLAGLPTQDVGAEYLIGLFEVHSDEPIVYAIDLNTFDTTGVGPAFVEGQTIRFELPLEFLGGDDGNMDVDLVLGDQSQPLDYAPDTGHGTIVPFSDVPWLSESPESGTTEPGTATDVTLNLGSAGLAPGTYKALVVFVTNAPRQRQIPVEVTLTVTMPDAFGALAGTVTDAHSGEPLAGAAVVVHTTWQGDPLELTTTSASDGTWQVVGPEGTWTAEFGATGYVAASRSVDIVAGTTTGGADMALHLDQSHAAIDGGPFVFVLTPGRTGHGTIVVSNPDGHRDLTFSIGEVDLGSTTEAEAAKAKAAATAARRTLPAGANANARTSRGIFGPTSGVKPATAGDVLGSFPTGLDIPWGVGYTGNLWIGNAFANGDACGLSDGCSATEFTSAGSPTGNSFEEPWVEVFGGDMAWDAGRSLLWQVNIGGDNAIYGLDPTDGTVVDVITGSPWSNVSQRGLAYDGANDEFYIGGWNEGIVYRVAGPSHPTPGATLGQCAPEDPAISGLAWNGSFRMLWVQTNSETDDISLIDPTTCETSTTIGHPEGGGFNGAGLETDVVGNLWTVGQNSGDAWLIESGLPNFSDASWLTVTPGDGTVAPDGSLDVDVAVDSTGLVPGVYRALIVVQTNDPDHSVSTIPVELVVPAYQQGVNAGGGSYVDADGNLFGADRAWSAGSFGWLGASSSRSTKSPIAGTTEDGLYQDLRTGMSGYRFDVANGRYRVDLAFAEIVAKKAGARTFSVTIEGTTVIAGLDVFAASGGKNAALDRSFEVDVSDGHLDIGFAAQRGDTPIVNGILVTEVPPGS
ncbi:MAG TPA: carboxypeptidase regulatory-like domain-containing protein [Methylomirabilota bacterium]|nr:carboxypeptidase regulatory-like domain-containing protein [Methylomirabilota bacterium]